MDFVRFIRTAFDYDRWANRQWLSRLEGFKDMNRPYQILEHILQAQQTWLTRAGALIGRQKRDMSLQELFDITSEGWEQLMQQASPDEMITYTNSRGETYTEPLGQIHDSKIGIITYLQQTFVSNPVNQRGVVRSELNHALQRKQVFRKRKREHSGQQSLNSGHAAGTGGIGLCFFCERVRRVIAA